MLKIKLARFGRKGQPMYRIVINEARDKRDGKYVAKVGHYFPQEEPKVLEMDLDAVKDWIKKGAQPTDTVAALIKRYESGNPFPTKKKKLSKKAKAKLAAAKEDKKDKKEDSAKDKQPVEAKQAKKVDKESESKDKENPSADKKETDKKQDKKNEDKGQNKAADNKKTAKTDK